MLGLGLKAEFLALALKPKSSALQPAALALPHKAFALLCLALVSYPVALLAGRQEEHPIFL